MGPPLRPVFTILSKGSSLTVCTPGTAAPLLPGAFQASNALVALALAMSTGAPRDAALNALATLRGAKGRLELVGQVNDSAIFVDYAHSPDALKNALQSLRPYASGRLTVVFGCGGDRDRAKRPVMGRIAAGTPIEAISHASRHVAVPAAMLAGAARHFALEVKGDSMIEAGINDGDIVVIQQQPTAQNGDIVVALIEGEEATLKTFRRRGSTIALEAANPAYETRLYQDHQVQVQGKLVGLIRTY